MSRRSSPSRCPTSTGTVYDRPYIPDDQSDNFLGFEVSVDGKAVKPTLEQKAFALGIDIGDLLKANNVPVNPFTQPVFKALESLSEADRAGLDQPRPALHRFLRRRRRLEDMCARRCGR